MKQDLLITASYRPHYPVPTKTVITRGGRLNGGWAGGACPGYGLVDSRFESVGTKLGLLIASPLILLFHGLLKLFRVSGENEVDLAALDAIADELDQISAANRFWTHAIEAMIEQGERARAKGKTFTAPDWFIWLQRYGVCISPARLKAIMAALSVKGRAHVMGLVSSLSSSFVTTSLMSPQDEDSGGKGDLCHALPWPD